MNIHNYTYIHTYIHTFIRTYSYVFISQTGTYVRTYKVREAYKQIHMSTRETENTNLNATINPH